MTEDVEFAFDFDHTLFDTLKAWRFVTGDERFTESCIDYYHKMVDITKTFDHLDELLIRVHSFETMMLFGLMDGAVEFLTNLTSNKITWSIATARSPKRLPAILQLLHYFDLHPLGVFSTQKKSKIKFCLKHGMTHLVDDHPEALREGHAIGFPVASIRHHWNYETIDELGIPNGKDWHELGPKLMSMIQSR